MKHLLWDRWKLWHLESAPCYQTILRLKLLEVKESYQGIPPVCIVSAVKDGLGQAVIGIKSMFTSHLSYRGGSLPSTRRRPPPPLTSHFSIPAFLFIACSAVEQHTDYNNVWEVEVETAKKQNSIDITCITFMYVLWTCIVLAPINLSLQG